MSTRTDTIKTREPRRRRAAATQSVSRFLTYLGIALILAAGAGFIYIAVDPYLVFEGKKKPAIIPAGYLPSSSSSNPSQQLPLRAAVLEASATFHVVSSSRDAKPLAKNSPKASRGSAQSNATPFTKMHHPGWTRSESRKSAETTFVVASSDRRTSNALFLNTVAGSSPTSLSPAIATDATVKPLKCLSDPTQVSDTKPNIKEKKPGVLERAWEWIRNIFRRRQKLAVDLQLVPSSATINLPCPPGTTSESCPALTGQSVQLVSKISNSPDDTFRYEYDVNKKGRITGKGPRVSWNLTGLESGTYVAKVRVIRKDGAEASATANVTVAPACKDCGLKRNSPPTVTLSALTRNLILSCPAQTDFSGPCASNLSSVVTLVSSAADSDGDSLRYTYSATVGRIQSIGLRLVSWDLSGAKPGTYTATVEVEDGNKGRSFASTTVTISEPAAGCCVPPCPEVSVACPTELLEVGQLATAFANVNGGDPDASLTYNWTVSAGTINSGQGTVAITIDTTGLAGGQQVTATVQIGGMPPECVTTDACTYSVSAPSPSPGPSPSSRPSPQPSARPDVSPSPSVDPSPSPVASPVPSPSGSRDSINYEVQSAERDLVSLFYPKSVAKTWRKKIYIELDRLQPGAQTPTLPELNYNATHSVPPPIPIATPGATISRAFGDRYEARAWITTDLKGLKIVSQDLDIKSLDPGSVSWSMMIEPEESASREAGGNLKMYVEWKDRRTGELFLDDNGKPYLWEAWTNNFSTQVDEADLTRNAALIGSGASGSAGLSCFALMAIPSARSRRSLAAARARRKSAKPLYVNLWFESAKQTRLAQPIRMITGSTYYFFFAIESQLRDYSLVREVFKLDDKLTEVAIVNASIEIVCPFIEESGEGFALRDIEFHRDLGIIPEKFALRPETTGKFYVTARLWIGEEIRYRTVLIVKVYPSKYAVMWAELMDWLSATPLTQAFKSPGRLANVRSGDD